MTVSSVTTTNLVCDRSGSTATTVSPDPMLPPGWRYLTSPEPATAPLLLCPECTALFDAFLAAGKGAAS